MQWSAAAASSSSSSSSSSSAAAACPNLQQQQTGIERHRHRHLHLQHHHPPQEERATTRGASPPPPPPPREYPRSALLKLIKSCGRLKQLRKAKRIHAYLVEEELLPPAAPAADGCYLGTALLRAYAECGAVQDARAVLEALGEQRNVVAWTALMVGYARNGLHSQALGSFQKMQEEGIRPDAVTYACILTSCGILGNLRIGESVAAEVRDRGLLLLQQQQQQQQRRRDGHGKQEHDSVLANALLGMYARCGCFARAEDELRQHSGRTIASWNALIAAYNQHGLAHQAMECFERLLLQEEQEQELRLRPNAVTYICALRACALARSLALGRRIDAEVRKQRLLRKDIALATSLLDMYAKCCAPEASTEVFDLLPARDLVSYNVLISGYVHNGLAPDALTAFRRMQDEGICPDAVTFASVLNACAMAGSLKLGEELDARIGMRGEEEQQQRRQGLFLLRHDLALGNTLVDMYAKCAAMDRATDAFERLPSRDVVSWNVLMSGYVQHGLGEEALDRFRTMRDEGIVPPNAVTCIAGLKACSLVRCLEAGEEICAEAGERGLFESNAVLSTAMLDMYSKCGVLEKAVAAFEQLLERDVVAWNSLMGGCVQHGRGDDALECFAQMQDEGVCPDALTYVYVLKACGTLGSLELGDGICSRIGGLREKDAMLSNAAVDMYAKCGAFGKAREALLRDGGIRTRDAVVAWTALIAGYAQHGCCHEALQCFEQMLDEGVRPDAVACACVLKACASLGSLETGEAIAGRCREQGLSPHDSLAVGNALVEMYARCGAADDARAAFQRLGQQRDPASWNALISASAQIGRGDAALGVLREMSTTVHAVPDSGSLAGVLAACAHDGLLKEGEKLFRSMPSVYGIPPELDHYTCMVNLLGRAGRLDAAIALLDEAPPSSHHLPMLLAVLGSCHKWNAAKLGEWAFQQSLRLDASCASAYVFMGNIYAAG